MNFDKIMKELKLWVIGLIAVSALGWQGHDYLFNEPAPILSTPPSDVIDAPIGDDGPANHVLWFAQVTYEKADTTKGGATPNVPYRYHFTRIVKMRTLETITPKLEWVDKFDALPDAVEGAKPVYLEPLFSIPTK